MAIPLQISYHTVERSDALDKLVEDEAAKLERFFGGILNCRVLIEHTHHHQRSGAPFQARIALSVPGEDIFINHGPDVHSSLLSENENENPPRVQKATNVDAAFKDPALAIRSAFRKARRRLQDYVRLLDEPSFRYE